MRLTPPAAPSASAAESDPGPYPKIELGEPIQAVGPAGSVLFAHYLLGVCSPWSCWRRWSLSVRVQMP